MTTLRAVARRARAAALALLFGAATAPLAQAQAPKPAQASHEQVAQDLFERGRLSWKEADYETAASLFMASFRESPQPGALILLADCQERLGKLQSAYEKFVRGAQLAQEAGDAELAQRARTRAALLPPRIPELELRLSRPLPAGLLVTLDGVEVPAEQLNTPLPLDAGIHALKARAPGYADFETQLQVDNGPTATPGPQVVAVTLLAQSATPLVVPAELQPDPFAPAALVSSAPEPDAAEGSGMDRRTFAWIAGGVGLVAGVVGGVLYAGAKADYDEATDAHCQKIDAELYCDAEGRHLQQQARGKANWATVAAIVATAGLGGGVYAYVTSEEGSATPSAVGIRFDGRF